MTGARRALRGLVLGSLCIAISLMAESPALAGRGTVKMTTKKDGLTKTVQIEPHGSWVASTKYLGITLLNSYSGQLSPEQASELQKLVADSRLLEDVKQCIAHCAPTDEAWSVLEVSDVKYDRMPIICSSDGIVLESISNICDQTVKKAAVLQTQKIVDSLINESQCSKDKADTNTKQGKQVLEYLEFICPTAGPVPSSNAAPDAVNFDYGWYDSKTSNYWRSDSHENQSPYFSRQAQLLLQGSRSETVAQLAAAWGCSEEDAKKHIFNIARTFIDNHGIDIPEVNEKHVADEDFPEIWKEIKRISGYPV